VAVIVKPKHIVLLKKRVLTKNLLFLLNSGGFDEGFTMTSVTSRSKSIAALRLCVLDGNVHACCCHGQLVKKENHNPMNNFRKQFRILFSAIKQQILELSEQSTDNLYSFFFFNLRADSRIVIFI
jgi:hypothetical protein